jgi:hypothetical protein
VHKIALVLAIAAVGEGLLALHLVRQLHQERESAQALQARVTELERRLPQRAAGAAIAAVPAQPAAAPFTVVSPSAPAPSQQQAQQQQPPIASEPDPAEMHAQMAAGLERQRALLRDPEYRQAMLAQQKIMMMRMNPDLGRDLELTPDQVDQLYTTLGEQYVRQLETQEIPPFAYDAAPDPAKLRELERKSTQQLQANLAEIRKVLGDAKFREFEEYQAMAGARSEASRIREALATAGVPLDDTLAKPLARVLHEHQEKLMRASATAAAADAQLAVGRVGFVHEAPDSFDDVEMQQQNLESMAKFQHQQREALARVLSPQQLEVIEEEQESALQLQRAQLRIMQAQPQAPAAD